MELIGVPIRITVGKKLNDGYVEFKLRTEDKAIDIKTTEILDYIKNYIKEN